MSNMSYCRFRNTLGDFNDCLDYLNEPLSKNEARARAKLVTQAARLLEGLGVEIDTEQVTEAIKDLPTEEEDDE